MALVTITGNVWDAGNTPIPASQEPRLWAKPKGEYIGEGLSTATEVQATLNAATGAFTIDVESVPGLFYDFELDWLIPGQEDEPPERRARGFAQWLSIYPGAGGHISGLGPWAGLLGVLFGFGPPPPHLTAAIYLDITGPDIGIYGPAGGIL